MVFAKGLSIRREMWIPFCLINILALVVYIVFTKNAEELDSVYQRNALEDRLQSIITGMQSELLRNTSLVYSLSAFVTSNPDFTDEDFSTYVSSVMDRYSGIVNMAAAPDLVIRHVYPYEGNEAALGLEYKTRPEQMVAIERAIREKALVYAGPVDLVQGGAAFIVQVPVFLPESGALWGIVSMPIRTSDLYESTGLSEVMGDQTIAIRGRDSRGQDGAVFFGDAEVFRHPDAMIFSIDVGDGSWQIAGLPSSQVLVGDRFLIIKITTILAILLNYVGFRNISRNREKEEAFREKLVKNEKFLRQVERVSEVGGWRLNLNREFTDISEFACRIAGIENGQQKTALQIDYPVYTPESQKAVKDIFEFALENRQAIDTSIEVHRADGDSVWMHFQAEPSGEGDQFELVGAVRDITKEVRAREQIEFQNNYNQLTRLPNRQLLNDRIKSAINRAERSDEKVAVCFLDIDNFKAINDRLGIEGGDQFLVKIASRIVSRLRSIDTVSHYSGDEFVLVLSDFEKDGYLVKVLDDLLEIIRKPYIHEDEELYSGASIGVTVFPGDARDAHDLILKAEQAMYVAKKSGKNDWNFYRAEMQAEADYRNQLYNDLVRVVEGNQLQVFFQPIIDATTHQIAGCESLVRWERNGNTWISPEVFIDIAEERGLVCTIDHQVLVKAIEAIRAYNKALDANIYLSVNASPKLLDKSEPVSDIWLGELRKCRDVSINIEITERVLMGDTVKTSEILNEIRENGQGLSLDDFGTGYSGLSYITRYPINTIKIDRSFVSKMISSEKEKTLVESMLILAGKLKMKVVAEGVETEEEYKLLSGMGCDYMQGYYFSGALPLNEFIEFSKSWQEKSRQ